jgi:hypothetical protein
MIIHAINLGTIQTGLLAQAISVFRDCFLIIYDRQVSWVDAGVAIAASTLVHQTQPQLILERPVNSG